MRLQIVADDRCETSASTNTVELKQLGRRTTVDPVDPATLVVVLAVVVRREAISSIWGVRQRAS